MYNDNKSTDASIKPLVYIVLDHRKTSGQLMLAICSGLVEFVVDIGDTVGQQYIDLDLLGMLGPVIDDLFSTIDGALDGLNNQSAETAALSDDVATQEEEPTGINKVFADLDVIKLLGEKGYYAQFESQRYVQRDD